MSTTKQDLTIQQEALRAAGCQVIRSEKKTGIKREGRRPSRAASAWRCRPSTGSCPISAAPVVDLLTRLAR
ncbi:hypothetical protein [uncultured Sphingomonas sp.]|uniref:hypothetical protein n=1 Tax=uncultured Sphingomonas sp. TaxID=158754 RepID=UPI0035CA7B1C